jgi:copper ion binding protein
MQKVVLTVSGMSCGHCVARVQKALMAVAGVADAQVSLADKCAVVTFDEAKVDKAGLAEAVTGAGYTIT